MKIAIKYSTHSCINIKYINCKYLLLRSIYIKYNILFRMKLKAVKNDTFSRQTSTQPIM